MLTARINDKELKIETSNNQILVDAIPFEWDLSRIDSRHFHIIHDHRSYEAEIVKVNWEEKKFVVKVNDRKFEIHIKDKFDMLLEKMGMSDLASQHATDIKAPMPGLIVDILVKEGDPVKKGDSIMILEAMKMENVIKAPGDGEVNSILVSKGDSVEKNQVLLGF